MLRLQDVEVLGTQNSDHERPNRPVLPLEPANYAHPPLNVQLAQEHVRSLEIDVFNEPKIPVMHSIMVDEQSNCPTLAACLRTVDAWSKANPGHLPVTLFIETKAIPTTTNRKTKRLIRQTRRTTRSRTGTAPASPASRRPSSGPSAGCC